MRRIPRSLRARANGPIIVKRTIAFNTDTNAGGGGTNNFFVGLFSSGVSMTIGTGSSIQIAYSTGTAGGIAYQGFNYQFNISNFVDFTYAVNMFDKYRIRKVKIKMTPYQTSSLSATGASASTTDYGQAAGFIHTVVDYNSVQNLAASEAGITLAMAYSTYRRARWPGKGISITLRPQAAQQVEVPGGSYTTALMVPRKTWLASVANTVAHFGVRAMTEMLVPSANTVAFAFRGEATYWVEFAAPR